MGCGQYGARAVRLTGHSGRTRNRAGDDRCSAERPCRRRHHPQGCSCADNRTPNNNGRHPRTEGEAATNPSAQARAGEGSTPDSARFAGAAYQRQVDEANNALESRISEAVAAAMRTAIPQLMQQPQQQQQQQQQQQGIQAAAETRCDEQAILACLRTHLASPDLQGYR